MTEAEWDCGDDPQRMLELLAEGGKLSDRKARLYAVACCRSVWDRLTDPASRRAVEAAERFADGREAKEEFEAAGDGALEAPWAFIDRGDRLGEGFAHAAVWATALDPATAAEVAARFARGCDQDQKRSDGRCRALDPSEEQRQALLLRCLFGNPFRTLAVNHTWFSYNDGTIPKLAEAIYQERAFDRLPILADALEEAGCTNAEILAHCRGSGPHARGCWVVDLVRFFD